MDRSYYDRTSATHLDGTPIFQTGADQDNERDVIKLIEAGWRCKVGSFGMLSPVDWYAQRDGRLVGLIEAKTRSHATTKYPSVFLNVRKWMALTMAAMGMRVPALYVVKFTDKTMWAPIAEIDATKTVIGGTFKIVKSVTDIEPMINVPLEVMRVLRSAREHMPDE